jgi:hypothetical protein
MLGKLSIVLILVFLGIFLREQLLHDSLDYYIVPCQKDHGFCRIENNNNLDFSQILYDPQKKFIVFAISNYGFYTLNLLSVDKGLVPITTLSKVNFTKIKIEQIEQKEVAIFSDGGMIHVITAENDTFFRRKVYFTWLPEKVFIKADSIYFCSDTCRVAMSY